MGFEDSRQRMAESMSRRALLVVDIGQHDAREWSYTTRLTHDRLVATAIDQPVKPSSGIRSPAAKR